MARTKAGTGTGSGPGGIVITFRAAARASTTSCGAARSTMPAWMAYDLRLMRSRIQALGQVPAEGAAQPLQALLGRPLRSYEAFAAERVAAG